MPRGPIARLPSSEIWMTSHVSVSISEIHYEEKRSVAAPWKILMGVTLAGRNRHRIPRLDSAHPSCPYQKSYEDLVLIMGNPRKKHLIYPSPPACLARQTDQQRCSPTDSHNGISASPLATPSYLTGTTASTAG